MSLNLFKFSYGILVGLCLLFFIPQQQVFAQSTNTAHGFEALQAANGTALYPIERIDVVSSGYAYPTLSFNAPVEWLYKSESVGFEYYGYAEIKTTAATIIPTLTGGYGNGNINFYSEIYDFDGTYYYHLVEVYGATGYAPQMTINPVAQGFENYHYGCYLNTNGTISAYYYDSQKLNTYSTAPQVSFSFGNAVGTAVLSGTSSNGENTSVGYQALKNNTSSKNTAIGFKALSGSTTGVENITLGYEVGKTLSKGNRNVFLGHQAGNGITTGSGNTIIGGGYGTLASNLNSTVIIADGYGSPRLYSPSSGNVMIGYGNNPSDGGYKLDVNGAIRAGSFIGKYGDYLVNPSTIDNTIITPNPNQIIQAPTSTAFTDLLSFNKKGYIISHETSSNLVDFSPAILDKTFFVGKNGTDAQRVIIDGNIKAVRWTFEGVIWDNSKWIALEWGYASGYNGVSKILIEESNDGFSWSQINLSYYANSTSGLKSYHYLNRTHSRNFLRLTISNTTPSTTIRLSNIKLLTQRIGNQGGASEYSYPYTWNKDGWIGINKGLEEPQYPLDVVGDGKFTGNIIASNISGTNTGDETQATIINKLGFTPLANTLNFKENNTENLAIGNNALTFVDAQPMLENVAIGSEALRYTTTGKENTAVGVWNLRANTTGYGNTAVGNYVMFKSTTGYGNTGIGKNALQDLETGIENTALGFSAFRNITSGNKNVGIGRQAGALVTTGSFNTIIGSYIQGSPELSKTVIIGDGEGVDGSIRFYSPASGNILLGTTSDNGIDKLQVNGNIKAKAVKVDPNAWPDYVFETNYPLLSLKDIEAFIQKNKHLPEVPSASEVAARGHDLGEMNTILLKKIEELTLYIIEQDKRIKKLEATQEANPINKP